MNDFTLSPVSILLFLLMMTVNVYLLIAILNFVPISPIFQVTEILQMRPAPDTSDLKLLRENLCFEKKIFCNIIKKENIHQKFIKSHNKMF